MVLYDVVVTGKASADEDTTVVALRLADLAKVSKEEATDLLAKPVVIKRDVDEPTANRYQAAMLRIGVRCELSPKESISLDLPQPAETPPPIPSRSAVSVPSAPPPLPNRRSVAPSSDEASGSLISCNGCGAKIHAFAAECPHCGTPRSEPASIQSGPVATEGQTPTRKLTRKQKFLYRYLAVAALFTIWNTFFGSQNYRGFFFNLGLSLVWPFQVFPIFGKIIGSIILLACIVYFVILDPKKTPPPKEDR